MAKIMGKALNSTAQRIHTRTESGTKIQRSVCGAEGQMSDNRVNSGTRRRKQPVRVVSPKLFQGRARSTPATSERGNDGAAEIGEVSVGERSAIGAGVQRSEKDF